MKVKVKDLHEGYWLHGDEGGRARIVDRPWRVTDGQIVFVPTEFGVVKFYSDDDPMELEIEVELA